MKHLFSWVLAALFLCPPALAQVMPAAPPTSLQGQELKTWLRQNWYEGQRNILSYSEARGKMYNFVDNYNNRVTCVYSGYQETVALDSTATSPGVVSRINCEHTVPQSWFDEAVRMRSDIHHLFPTYDTWNSRRGSDPFAEIPDSQTLLWMRGTQSQTGIPGTNIDEYSEDTNAEFEPREDHKGNLARAAFYFYTAHQGQTFDPGKDDIAALANLQTLYQWHLQDPVDDHERERNRRVAKSQGNFNPYIAYPELVARAWGFQPAGPSISFTTATGSLVEGNSGTTTYPVTITVSPAPADAFTVQVVADAANSTATSPDDYTFTAATLTFGPNQTTQTVTVTVVGDTQPEPDETLVLRLQNVVGAATIGSGSHILTILNDDGLAPTLAFATSTGTITEGNSGSKIYTVNVTLTGSAPTTAVTVPISVDAAGTTATSPDDYTLTTTSLTFAAGQVNQTLPVAVTVQGDAVPEPDETVRLRLGTPTGGAGLGPIATHTLTIQNDDQYPAGSNRPFFSQYVESSTGNTKVLEIFNPNASPLSLSGLRVVLYANGATTPTTTENLTGTVAPGDVYVIANPGSIAAVLAVADLTSNVTSFNGDDALALFSGTDTLDVIGVIGQRPAATGWVLPDNGTTTNNTIGRQPAVCGGETRWAARSAATWSSLGMDVYTGLGSHTSSCLVLGTQAAGRTRSRLEVYPNPAATTVQVRLPGLLARQTATIELYNNTGQLVLTQQTDLNATAATAVSVQQLPAGLYSVRVTVGGAAYRSRVVVGQ